MGDGEGPYRSHNTADEEDKASFREFADTFQDIADFQRQLKETDDVEFYWRVRHDLDKAWKFNLRHVRRV